MSKKSENLTHQELLLAIIETRTAVLQAASQLTPEAQNTAFFGVWSVKDLIARGHPIRGIHKFSGLIVKGDCHICMSGF